MPQALIPAHPRAQSHGRKRRKHGQNKATVEGKQSRQNNRRQTEKSRNHSNPANQPASRAPIRRMAGIKNKRSNDFTVHLSNKALDGDANIAKLVITAEERARQAKPRQKETARPHLCSAVGARPSSGRETRARPPAPNRTTTPTTLTNCRLPGPPCFSGTRELPTHAVRRSAAKSINPSSRRSPRPPNRP